MRAQRWLLDAVMQETDECQLWPFFRLRGYAQGWDAKRKRPGANMSKVAWELGHESDWPEGMEARHLCGRGADGCVNWRHITPGTHAQNMADGSRAYGERHHSARLTEGDVVAILEEMRAGGLAKDLADRYGVSAGTISDIWNGQTWTHVPGVRRQRLCPTCGSPTTGRRRYCSNQCNVIALREGRRLYKPYSR